MKGTAMPSFSKRYDGSIDHFRIWSLILMIVTPLVLAAPMPPEWEGFQKALVGALGAASAALGQYAGSPRDADKLRDAAASTDAAAVGEA